MQDNQHDEERDTSLDPNRPASSGVSAPTEDGIEARPAASVMSVLPKRQDDDEDGAAFARVWSNFVQANGELVYPDEHCPTCKKRGVVDAWGRRYIAYRFEDHRHYLGHVCEEA